MKKMKNVGLVFWVTGDFSAYIFWIMFVVLVAGCSGVKHESYPSVEEAVTAPSPEPVEEAVIVPSYPSPTPVKKEAEKSPGKLLKQSAKITVPPSEFLPNYPWPPEEPSWLVRLDRLYPLITPDLSLYDVSEILSRALQGALYNTISYYRAPGGFVMVTRLEGIDKNGVSLVDNRRYLLPDDRQDFSFFEYVRSLFFAPEGYYRFIAFVVSDAIYTTEEISLSEDAAIKRLKRGATALPSEYRNMMFSPEHRVDALIYEFHKGGSKREAKLMQPGRLDPNMHLEKSGLSQAFTHVLKSH